MGGAGGAGEGPLGLAAWRMHDECPVRLTPLVHREGHCRHYRPPDGGRVGAFQKRGGAFEVPEGWVATEAQALLDSAKGAGDVGEGEG
jgi:hypothetical protein